MKDLVYENDKNNKKLFEGDSFFADVKTLAKYENNPDAIYQIVTKYEDRNGCGVAIKSVRSLDRAIEILKDDFLKDCSSLFDRTFSAEEELEYIVNEDLAEYELQKTYAILDMDGDWITKYITVNILE